VRLAAIALVCGSLLAVASASAGPTAKEGGNWTRFGYSPTRSNEGPEKTGLTPGNVGRLVRQQVQLGGTVDSSPLYIRGKKIGDAVHDSFIAQTTYGLVYAIEADNGAVLWQFTPDGYESYAGSEQITTASPVVDAAKGFVYSVSPDGLVHKLALSDGTEIRTDAWPARITLDAAHEKITSPLGLWGKLVTATTSSYHDEPPYQGHVVTIDRDTGRIVHVWNALCSDRHELIDPTTCLNGAGTDVIFGASIWARAGAVRQPGTGNLLVTTANGIFDGHTRWSTSVLMLSPDAGRLLKYWTPSNWEALSSQDDDLGSTAPALVTPNLIVQGGKDGKLRLIDLKKFRSPPSVGKSPVLSKALQTVTAPGGGIVFTAPAVWTNKGVTWLYVATNKGFASYVLKDRRLVRKWTKSVGGTSPVVAGGLLYVYDWNGGELNVYVPTTGKLVASLPVGRGHWNTPIVTDGRVALGQEDANAHVTFGVLNIYRLP
jgi:outer membrane protein assembly factor BamB